MNLSIRSRYYRICKYSGRASVAVGMGQIFFFSIIGFLKPLKKFCLFSCVISVLLQL